MMTDHKPGCAAWFYGDADCDSKCDSDRVAVPTKLARMELSVFCGFLAQELRGFADYWFENSVKDSEKHPKEMLYQEWLKQFDAWRKSMG